jgi:hypothetical protein
MAPLIGLLNDPDDQVKLAAGEAVSDYRYDAHAAVPALIQMWQSSNRDLKTVAGRALNRIDPDAARQAGVPQ